MDVVVALDFRFRTTPDGRVWTSSAFGHSFWERYLDVFDRVRIVARAANVEQPQAGDQRVDGVDVSFRKIPFYQGPAQYLRKMFQVRRAAIGSMGDRDAVILRAGSQLATCMAPTLWRAGRPYGLEVIGDPYDTFAPGAMSHPLRPFLRWRNARSLRRECARACGAAYVTEAALQRRYACPQYSIGVSDVQLGSEYWGVESDRNAALKERRLIFVGTLEQLYKAPDVLLDAMSFCVQTDPSLNLILIGGGRHLSELQSRAAALGLHERVRFLGNLPGPAVREELDRSSLFVLPSRQEGLPRAMVEAMARGLPCIGAAVGGIPELLAEDELVQAGDAGALARKILEVMRDPARMERLSARNRHKASQFREEVLRPRRVAFYRHVADTTSKWLAGQNHPQFRKETR